VLELVRRAARGGERPGDEDDRVRRQAAVALVAIAVPLGAILVKGALDVRFHLLYLPVLVPHAAALVERWHREGTPRAVHAVAGAASWLFVAAALPDDRRWLAAWVLVGLAIAAGTVRPRARAWTLATSAAFALAASAALGPLDWGRRLAWEPGPAPEVPRAVESFETPELEIARCAVDREGRDAAAPLVRRALERRPADRATVLGAGALLVDRGGADARRVLELAASLARRDPSDRELAALVTRAMAAAAAPGPATSDTPGRQTFH
jgi:hypothetical protein